MYIKEYDSTRKDGVRLFINIDALIDEKGNVVYEPVLNEKGEEIGKRPVPRGFYIIQNETQILYAEAIDVEDAPYTYSETDVPIEVEESVEENIEKWLEVVI